MESKINPKMIAHSSASTSDPTDSGVSDVMDAGYRSGSKPPAGCLSSVRNFGTAGVLMHGLSSNSDCAVFKDVTEAAKQFYDRESEFLKSDHAQWDEYVKVRRTNLSLSSTSGACKFIKDEKEPTVIMDSFDPVPVPVPVPVPEMSALESCCSSESKPLLGIGEGGDPGGFPQIISVPRAGMEGSPNYVLDLNQSEQLANPMQTSPTEPQFWCQPTGGTEDAFTATNYDGIQNQGLAQRNPSPFSGFPGMQPQRLCVICSDEASGCHYGVLTCGSCKVFFKRAVEGHHSYLCAGRNDCIVDKIRRKNCPACRLRKCYQAGMMLGGRKLKRFGALKALGLAPSLMFQTHLAMSGDSQALTSMSCIPGIHEMQLSQQIISILENIEPETVYSGYDSSQPEVPHLLLNSLNRLCEKQLLWIVKWSKSLPGFRNLHINDQMTLIQYSWMNLMVFSLGWRSFQNVTSEYLYFAPDLILSQEQMRRSPIYDLCLAIQFIPQEFANLQVTREEFLCMKAIILLNTVPLEGLKSQVAFEEMRQNYIRELSRAIHMKEKGLVASSQRFYHLTKLMDAMHDIVKKVNLFCLSTFIQADAMKVEFPEMMSEVIASQLPKVLAGMVRPLLFHTK
ncbi:progesterone receptor isoform 2-T2 [Menidia menidia]